MPSLLDEPRSDVKPPRRLGSRRAAVVPVVAFALGVAVTLVAAWMLRDESGRVRPVVQQGLAFTIGSGDVMSFEPSDGSRAIPDAPLPVQGYSIASVAWQDTEGTWHEGRPECVEVGDQAPVEIAVLHSKSVAGGPGRSVLVWLRCLG